MSDATQGVRGSVRMSVESVAIGSVMHDPANVRRHDERNLEAIRGSLARFGQQKPIVVDADGIVRAGNGTLTAAKMLGWTHIDVVRTNLRGSEATAYAIADNRSAELAEWDDDALARQLAALQIDDEALAAATGFDAKEIAAMVEVPEVVDDEVPEPPADPVTKPGDLWLLGDHRLLCGDSTSKDCVAHAIGDMAPFIMVTDPPYGVDYDPEWRKEIGLNDSERMGKVENDTRVDWTDAYRLFSGDVAYVWHASYFTIDVGSNLIEAGFNIRASIIWRKPTFAISRGHYHWQHEPCWYAVRNGRTSKWCGDCSQSTVWDISNRVNSEGKNQHSTQKPIECMARPIRNHGGRDDGVYDPFLGSGTTLIAAEQLGRRCCGLEISPAYCDVIVQRWEALTGGKARRENG